MPGGLNREGAYCNYHVQDKSLTYQMPFHPLAGAMWTSAADQVALPCQEDTGCSYDFSVCVD